jgi:SAM-dependent methyltransferase
MATITRVRQLLQRDGVRATLLAGIAVVIDRRVNPFDRRFQTHTDGFVAKSELRRTAVGGSRNLGSSYMPTNTMSFRRFLKVAIGKPTGRFVDYGCGRGRVVLLAALHGFQAATGVEHDPLLAAQAIDNVKAFRQRTELLTTTDIVIHMGDAARWTVPDDTTVAYFYNPFALPVIEQVLDAIDQSIARRPRGVSLVFQCFPDDAADVPEPLASRLVLDRVETCWGKRYHLFHPAAR